MIPTDSSNTSADHLDFSLEGGRRLAIGAGPATCQALDAAKRPVWRLRACRWRDEQGEWRIPERWELIEHGQAGCTLEALSDGKPRGTLSFSLGEPGFRLEWSAPGAAWLAIELGADPDEHFPGMGERFDRIDQRGREVDLQVVNGASGGLACQWSPRCRPAVL